MTLVDTATVAAALGVSERTVRRWVRDGDLTNHGTPRRVLLDLDQCDTARARRAYRRLDTVSARL